MKKMDRARWAVRYTLNLVRYFGMYRRERLMCASLVGLITVWREAR